MHQSLFLCIIFLFLYTCFLYIQSGNFLKDIFYGFSHEISNYILIGIQCFTILFGGIVAAFIIMPSILFSTSLICLVIGTGIFEIHAYMIAEDVNPNHENFQVLYYLGIVFFGVFYGLFRFIIPVMILNQRDSRSIGRKSEEWFLVLNVCYLIVLIILPKPIKTSHYILFDIPIIITGLLLVLIGHGRKWYEIYSEPINIKSLIELIKKTKLCSTIKKDEERKEILHGFLNNQDIDTTDEDNESKKMLLALSKSIIIFILFIPYGICESQNNYAYKYQSNHLRQPKFISYYFEKLNFWPLFFSSFSTIGFITILWYLRKSFPAIYYKIYPENIKFRILFGNILMIVSTLLNGGLEAWRLEVFWGYNRTTMIPSPESFNQTIGKQTFQSANLSVFFMVPQITILGISEVYFILAGIELMDMISMKNMKYLSMALMMAANGNGGFSDSFFLSIETFHIFHPDDLNIRLPDNTGRCCSYESRLDYVLYGLAVVAFISLVISMILMKRFKDVFVKNQDLEREHINQTDSL